MDAHEDAYGLQLLAQLDSHEPTAELIERDDNYIDAGSDAGMYFTAFDEWSPHEQKAIKHARGRVLDIGCGAGRHALYLQKTCAVTAIDNSPGAIDVCKQRGVIDARVLSIADIDQLAGPFDSVVMLGNNFGLFGSADGVTTILAKLAALTTPAAKIIVGTLDPYSTTDRDHLDYHERNRALGRMPGQIRFRVRYRRTVGEWFDYLFVSRDEMKALVEPTAWKVSELIDSDHNSYCAILTKR